jgi:integrase/recombinase XerD
MCQLIIGIYTDCGLDGATSHSGRRTLITNLANKGISVKILAEIAGHASIQTTARYISVNDDLMRAAVDMG